MKLNALLINEFRCFPAARVHFEDDLTVIVAPNGRGKTAILDGVSFGFGAIYRGLPGVKTKELTLQDIRVIEGERQVNFCALTFVAEYQGKRFIWRRQKRKNTAVRMVETSQSALENDVIDVELSYSAKGDQSASARSLTLSMLDAHNKGQEFDIPLIIYYGTERAVRAEVKRRRGFKKAFSRFDALSGALDASSSFRSALEWFNGMEELERREKVRRGDFEFTLDDLDVVRKAICDLLPPGHQNPRVEMRPMRFVIDQVAENGIRRTLRLGQLSDGYKIMLAMAMDMSRRMVEANPSSNGKNPLHSESIVLIDEVDLHLHPGWQQTILTDLRSTFPNTQFIVTTHSPQVLTTVPARCLRRISFENGEASIESGFKFLEGARADYVLEELLGVAPRPEHLEITQKLNAYRELVQQDKWDDPSAVQLRRDLNVWGKGYEGELEKLDIDIRVREFRRGKRV